MQTPELVTATSGAISFTTPQRSAMASCSAAGKLLSGGYRVNGSLPQVTAVVVNRAEPDGTLTSFTVEISRLATGATGPGDSFTTVTAYAFCAP